jgi:hypothetical protein
MMTDEQKAVYSETGQWVRLTNMAMWGTAAVFFPLTLTPVYLALTTNVSRWWLGLTSVIIGLFWCYLDSLYDRGAKSARTMLCAMETDPACAFTPGAPGLRLYVAQARVLASGPSSSTLLIIFIIALIIVWCVIAFAHVQPVAPMK